MPVKRKKAATKKKNIQMAKGKTIQQQIVNVKVGSTNPPKKRTYRRKPPPNPPSSKPSEGGAGVLTGWLSPPIPPPPPAQFNPLPQSNISYLPQTFNRSENYPLAISQANQGLINGSSVPSLVGPADVIRAELPITPFNAPPENASAKLTMDELRQIEFKGEQSNDYLLNVHQQEKDKYFKPSNSYNFQSIPNLMKTSDATVPPEIIQERLSKDIKPPDIIVDEEIFSEAILAQKEQQTPVVGKWVNDYNKGQGYYRRQLNIAYKKQAREAYKNTENILRIQEQLHKFETPEERYIKIKNKSEVSEKPKRIRVEFSSESESDKLKNKLLSASPSKPVVIGGVKVYGYSESTPSIQAVKKAEEEKYSNILKKHDSGSEIELEIKPRKK